MSKFPGPTNAAGVNVSNIGSPDPNSYIRVADPGIAPGVDDARFPIVNDADIFPAVVKLRTAVNVPLVNPTRHFSAPIIITAIPEDA